MFKKEYKSTALTWIVTRAWTGFLKGIIEIVVPRRRCVCCRIPSSMARRHAAIVRWCHCAIRSTSIRIPVGRLASHQRGLRSGSGIAGSLRSVAGSTSWSASICGDTALLSGNSHNGNMISVHRNGLT